MIRNHAVHGPLCIAVIRAVPAQGVLGVAQRLKQRELTRCLDLARGLCALITAEVVGGVYAAELFVAEETAVALEI
jgi:hypothetical protein